MNFTYPQSGEPIAFVSADRSAFRFATRRARSGATAAAVAPVSSAPKTGPRGRFLIALLMLVACSAGVLTVWDSLIRYGTYGVVTGRLVEVSVPIDGVLTSVNVSEGDTVEQNARLAGVVAIDFEQQLARVADELRVAEVTLEAEIARIRWQSHVEETELTKSIAELFETTSRMHEESGQLEVLRYQSEYYRDLLARSAASRVDVDTFVIQEKSKEEELNSLQQAIRILKERAEQAASSPRPGVEQIQPMVARCQMLINEVSRLRQRIAQGDLRSPVNGTVLRRHHPSGECVKAQQTLFTVMEESSLEIELYLPQNKSHDYKVGDTLRLRIDPFAELIPCEVTFIGAEHRRPPESIAIFYRTGIQLLPVRLKPLGEFGGDRKLPVGAIAKLPRFGDLL